LGLTPQSLNGILFPMKQSIHAPDFLNEPIDYGKSFSRGIKVDLGKATFIFISGTASVDEKGRTAHAGDFAGQAKRTFNNITALLKSQGANWQDVIYTRCYLKDIEKDYDKFNEARNQFYKDQKLNPFPASACVEAKLCRSELLVEIEALAIVRS